jgi:hypothetical protein
MQQRHKELRPKTEAARQQADKGPRWQSAATSEKREDVQLDLQEDHRQHEDGETKSRILLLIVENQGLDLVEGLTPSEKEKETKGRAEAGNVETPGPNC